jgi:hypothetical protein
MKALAVVLLVAHAHLRTYGDAPIEGEQENGVSFLQREVTGGSPQTGVLHRAAPRVGICITGQLSRLEMQSKIRNLVAPMRALGSTVDVAFVLDPKRGVYTNDLVYGPFYAPDRYKSPEDLERFVTGSGVFAKQKFLAFDQPAEPLLNQGYVRALNKQEHGQNFTHLRAQNHVRQFLSLERCYGTLEDLERENGERYDVLARLRDDVYVPRPVDFAKAMGLLGQGVVLASGCDNWQGVSDKGALLDRSAAERFFRGPIDAYYNDTKIIDEVTKANGGHIDPEHFLNAAFRHAGLHVKNVESDVFSWMPETSKRRGTTCLHYFNETCFNAGDTDEARVASLRRLKC